MSSSQLGKHLGRAQDLLRDCSPSWVSSGKEVETGPEHKTATAQAKQLLRHFHLGLHPIAPCSSPTTEIMPLGTLLSADTNHCLSVWLDG